ncbi:MAG TPA: nitroreductase family protein, partial [Candidatus Mcinerneyibacterium sp.]|nr:nitroreductase family protein [Candidatus Mcinerneyibacterium sp.]
MNETIKVLKNHKTIRKYKNKDVSRKKIETIVRAGQQAPFVSQLYSVLYTKKGKIPFEANTYFIICVDFYKMKKIMEERNWEPVTNDLSILIFGIQDAAYMAQNMVVAAESMNLGTCFLGGV